MEVATRCSRVEEGQLQPLVWANDEDCPEEETVYHLNPIMMKCQLFDSSLACKYIRDNLQVRGMPLASFSSGSIIPYRVATLNFEYVQQFYCELAIQYFHAHLPFWVSNDGVREAGGEVVVCNDILDPAIVTIHLEQSYHQ